MEKIKLKREGRKIKMAKANMNKEAGVLSTNNRVKDTPVDKQEDKYSLFRETVVKLRQQQDYIKTLDQTYKQNEKHLRHMETLLKQNSEQGENILEETQRLLKEKVAYELEIKYWLSRANNSEITCAMEARLDEDLTQERRKLERERCLLIQAELDRKIDRKYIRKFDELRKQEQALRERRNKLVTQLLGIPYRLKPCKRLNTNSLMSIQKKMPWILVPKRPNFPG